MLNNSVETNERPETATEINAGKSVHETIQSAYIFMFSSYFPF